MSCSIIVSPASQKPNLCICTSKLTATSPTFSSFGNSNRALSLFPVSVSVCQLQLAWKKRRIRPFACKCRGRFDFRALCSYSEGNNCNCVSVDAENDQILEDGDGFIVVNFYHLVFIGEPEEEVSKHLFFMQGRDIHGRIYLNEQGINAQYSGPSKDAIAYLKWVKEDCRFADVLAQFSPAPKGHAFPRLKLRYKPALVQLEEGISHLPLLDPSVRATPLTPSQWRNRLEAVNKVQSSSDGDENCILLDVRNGYEWDVGHFHGAQRPDVDCFRSTSFGSSESKVSASDPLATVDKEKTDILMYCTGGIRCDVYSVILRQRGFKRLYTLKGGVSNYLKNEGSDGWVGNLFVFDSRLALPPSTYKPDLKTEASIAEVPQDNSFAKCYICGSVVSELRHRNCANIDCNFLYLCCMACVNQLQGCCCVKCTSASRLRPLLPGHQRYQKWHHYRDLELETR